MNRLTKLLRPLFLIINWVIAFLTLIVVWGGDAVAEHNQTYVSVTALMIAYFIHRAMKMREGQPSSKNEEQ
tara:strand:- start:660 stop:872 length:213 start_codon:yes stop_codon:yes gene_type:complete